MPRSRFVLPLLIVALALPAAQPALAGFFPPDKIDGPSPDIVSVGGVDVARDGTGGLVYVKRDGGVAHIFVSRLQDGAWQAPERLDTSLVAPSGEPVIAAASGGELVVAFTNGGTLYTVLHPAGASAWLGAVAVATPAATPSIDLSTNGVGYVAWAANGDVRVAHMGRLETTFTPLGDPLDVNPSDDSGSGTGRPEIAAPADGTAMVVWGEAGHVYARRVLGLTLSQYPQDATVPADQTFNGHPGGNADLPSVDAPDDSSFAWVVWRQAFDNGTTTRALARRFAGSTFDSPFDIGGGGFGAEGTDTPAVDASGANDVAFASDTSSSHTPFGELFYADRLGSLFQVGPGGAVPSQPKVAIGESSSTIVTWMHADAPGGMVSVHARNYKRGAPVAGEATVSSPALGSVDTAGGFFAAADKAGDTAIPYIEASGANRSLVASSWDRPPANLVVVTSTHWHNWPQIRWLPASEYWGKITYNVQIDGRVIGSFTKPRFSPRGLIADGAHRFVVIAVDRRGQTEASPARTLRIDTHPPHISFGIRGRKRAGVPLTLVARAFDPGPRADSSQLDYIRWDFGDSSPPGLGRHVRHAFTAGRWTVRATARDSAGNTTTIARSIVVS